MRAIVVAGPHSGVGKTTVATGLMAASESLFSPDGDVLLVSDWDADLVWVFDVSADTLVAAGSVPGIGLAEHMTMVARGASRGLVLVAAVNATGNVQKLQITNQTVTDIDQLDLVESPYTITVQP